MVGKPYASAPGVIQVIIRMRVFAVKRKELAQTIVSLIGSLRSEKGCRRCDFYRSMEDENELFILEEWDTRESFDCHLNSDGFRILRGAMNLLKEPYEMVFYTVVAEKLSSHVPSRPTVN